MTSNAGDPDGGEHTSIRGTGMQQYGRGTEPGSM